MQAAEEAKKAAAKAVADAKKAAEKQAADAKRAAEQAKRDAKRRLNGKGVGESLPAGVPLPAGGTASHTICP